ncbi:hypothetical protein BC831DRAFT_441784, partial [Entophlyctis helioformis]
MKPTTRRPPQKLLTSAERKVQKKKQSLAHLSKVKREYRKVLAKESRPETLQGDVRDSQQENSDDDDDDNQQQHDADTRRQEPQRQPQRRTGAHRSDAPADGEQGDNGRGTISKSGKGGKSDKQPQRRPRANPFANAAKKREQEKQEKEAAREAERQRREQEAAARQQRDAHKAAYIKQRHQTTVSLSKKTRKGQPVMANLIDHLLTKIQASQAASSS